MTYSEHRRRGHVIKPEDVLEINKSSDVARLIVDDDELEMRLVCRKRHEPQRLQIVRVEV